MNNNLQALKQEIIAKIEASTSLNDLEVVKNTYLSKKGILSQQMMMMKDLPKEERPEFGKIVNEVKAEVESALAIKLTELENAALDIKLQNEKIDVTLDADNISFGTIHPLVQVVTDLEDFFIGQGFEVKEGPEVESDYYNFEMMNFGKDHPARDMQDTFYINPDTLLRTHTSPVQARVMQAAKGSEIRIICPGKTYRRDEDDPTHSHQFMQIEGLVIGKDISFANLKDVLLNMVKHLFGSDREIRIRPSYFPFVEPGVEVDVVYQKDNGEKGYIEVLGAGMVHPNVLSMNGYDSDKYSGFAFGIGVERIAILKYKIEDIRNFYLNDLRFLTQFKGDLS